MNSYILIEYTVPTCQPSIIHELRVLAHDLEFLGLKQIILKISQVQTLWAISNSV